MATKTRICLRRKVIFSFKVKKENLILYLEWITESNLQIIRFI